MPISLLTQFFHPSRPRVRAPPRTKPMAVFVKILLKDRAQNALHRLLAYAVRYRWYPKRPLLFAPRLRYISPQDRFAPVRVVHESPAQFSKVFFLLLLPLHYTHPVHPRTPSVAHHFPGRNLQVVPIVHLVDHAVQNPSLHTYCPVARSVHET